MYRFWKKKRIYFFYSKIKRCDLKWNRINVNRYKLVEIIKINTMQHDRKGTNFNQRTNLRILNE